MKCARCQDKLEVTHVYAAGDRAETRNLVCPTCGFKATTVTFLVDRPQHSKRGFSARGLRAKILEGKLEAPEA